MDGPSQGDSRRGQKRKAGRPRLANLTPEEAARRKGERERKRAQRDRERAKKALTTIVETVVEETDPTTLSLGLRLQGVSLQPIEEEDAVLEAGVSVQEEHHSGAGDGQDHDIIADHDVEISGPEERHSEARDGQYNDNDIIADHNTNRILGAAPRATFVNPWTIGTPPRPSEHVHAQGRAPSQARSVTASSLGFFKQFHRRVGADTQESPIPNPPRPSTSIRLPSHFAEDTSLSVGSHESPRPPTNYSPRVESSTRPALSTAAQDALDVVGDSDSDEELPTPEELFAEIRRRNEAALEAERQEQERARAEQRRQDEIAEQERDLREWFEQYEEQRIAEAQQEAANESEEDRDRFRSPAGPREAGERPRRRRQQRRVEQGNHPDEEYADPGDNDDAVSQTESELLADPGDDDDAVSQTESEILAEAEEYTLRKVAEHFSAFPGCSTEQHDQIRQTHFEEHEGEHFSLERTYRDDSFPNVMAKDELLTNNDLQQLESPPRQSDWEDLFCGTDSTSDNTTRPRICLEEEETQEAAASEAHDVDSFCGSSSSLAVANYGVEFQPAPMSVHNITTDIHLERSAVRASHHNNADDSGEDNGPRPAPARSPERMEGAPDPIPSYRSTPIKDIAHFLFGRVTRAVHVAIYIFFPHLEYEGPKFKAMTHEHLRRWYDEVLYPAMHAVLEADVSQHIASTFDHAYMNSVAHQIEGRQVDGGGYEAQKANSVHIQPRYLHAIWERVLATNDRPGLRDFRDPQIFLNSKGDKLRWKSRPTEAESQLDAINSFTTFFENIFNTAYIDPTDFYADLGQEIVPTCSHLPNDNLSPDEQPQVYLWRPCCLESWVSWMYEGVPPKKGGPGQRYYTPNLLYDSCNLTSVTPKKSKLRKGGLIYTQLYSSVKEVYDTMQLHPFWNLGLETLALDKDVYRGISAIRKGRGRQLGILERAYIQSKRRAHEAFRASRQKSFGGRGELRVTLKFLRRYQEFLQERANAAMEENVPNGYPACPTFFWPIRTDSYLQYLERNANKFASGFEIVYARTRHRHVTWEETKIMSAFLRCLRFSFGAHQLAREGALWWGKRISPESAPTEWVKYGLGFENTQPQTGYCWIEGRIDWEKVEFHPNYREKILFGNNILQAEYSHRTAEVKAALSLTARVDQFLEWVHAAMPISSSATKKILRHLIALIIQEFRAAVLRAVPKDEFEEGQHEEATKSPEAFCHEYLVQLFGVVHLASGNRTERKTSNDMIAYLFFYHDRSIERRHWDKEPFRTMFQRVDKSLRDLREWRLWFGREFKDVVLDHNWVLPGPSGYGLLPAGKSGYRTWFSYDPDLDRKADWLKKNFRPGRPPRLIGRYPTLEWSTDRWKDYLERKGVPVFRDADI